MIAQYSCTHQSILIFKEDKLNPHINTSMQLGILMIMSKDIPDLGDNDWLHCNLWCNLW